MIVRKVRTGKDGRDSVRFYLTVSPQNFTVDTHGNIKETDKTVKVQAWTCVGSGIPAKASDNDVYLTVVPVKADGTKGSAIFAKSQASCSFTVSKTYAKYIVTLYNGVDKSNEWDSREVVIGNDGQNTVRLDLDNENDSILYDGAGNKLSADVVTKATLYDGGTPYTESPVTFSIPEGGKVNCEASITGNKVTVTKLTDTTAQVVIHAYYETLNKTYEAIFSIKKLVGVDKYDLVVSPNAVAFNSTTGKVQTGSSITVQVYRTPANGGTRAVVSKLSDYGLDLGCSVSGIMGSYSNGKATVTVSDTTAKNNANIILTLTKNSVSQDSETIPIVKAVDGTNSVRIDLDNENDSMLYDGSDTLISDNVSTTPHLYDGNTEKTSDATWSISAKSNVTLENNSWSGGALVVTGLSGTTGSVTVQAEYPKNSGKKYYCVFSIKKLVGVDKYDLEVTPNSISYNTSDGSGSSKDVTVRVWRTKQNGSRENIATLPTGYKLLIDGTNYGGSYKNKYYTFTAGVNVSSHTVILTDGTNTLDSETIPVLKAINGTSPYKLDLTNENTMVNCDYNGNVLSGAKYETSKVQILHGTADGYADFTVSVEADGITHGYNTSTHILNPSAITKDVATITVTATGKSGTEAAGLTLSAVMTITKNKPGKPGETPVMYSLIASHGVIHKDKDGSFLDTTMSFKVLKVEGTTQTMLDTYAKLYTQGISLFCSGFSTAINNNKTSNSEVVITCSDYFTADHREFYITKNSVELDREGIDVVSDGKTGFYIVANVHRDNFTEANWNTYGTVGHEESWTDTSSIRNGCRIGDYFTVTGKATDTKNSHRLTYVSTTASGNLKGKCISHEMTPAGANGNNAVEYDIVFSTAWARANEDGMITAGLAGYAYKINGTARTAISGASIRYGYLLDDSDTYVSDTANSSGYFSAGTWFNGDYLSDYAKNSSTIFAAIIVNGSVVCVKFVTIVQDGKTGASGSDYLPINCGIYDPTRSYSWTNGRREFVDYEINGEYKRYGVKTKGKTVAANNPPVSGGNSNWEELHTIQTLITNCIFGTNANIGGFYASAQRFISSVVAYYVRYKGNYSSTTSYKHSIEDTSDGMNTPTLEMVLYDSDYWVPKQSGSFSGQTPSTSSIYWRKATKEEISCAANGVNSKSPLYKLELNGMDGIIKLLHEDGYKWEVTKEGKQILGVDTGRHIEIDPNERELRIYDDNGTESVRFDGETIAALTSIFSGLSSPTITINSSSGSKGYTGNSSGGVSEKSEDVQLATFTTTNSGRVTIKATLQAKSNKKLVDTAYYNYDKIMFMDDAPVADIYGNYYIYNRSSISIRIKTVQTGQPNKWTYVGLSAGSNGENSWQTTTVTRDVVLPKGTHYIYATCYFRLQEGTSNTADVKWSGLTVSFVYDYYISRIFANGLVFGSSQNNFFSAMRESDGNMAVKAVTNNGQFGFELLDTGLATIWKGKRFRPTIVLGFGKITANKNNSGTYYDSISDSANAARDYVGSFSCERTSEGIHKLTFPTGWADLGLSTSNIFVSVVGHYKSSNQNVTCTVQTITTTYCTIAVGDDMSPNDQMNFFFKVEYMLP